MTYKGYRLSKRGKIVFSIFIILIIIAIFFSILMQNLNESVNLDTPDIPESTNQPQEPVIDSTPENAEKEITLEDGMLSLYFKPESTLLTLESKNALDEFIKMENLITTHTIRIEGNCATLYKRKLSEAENQANIEFALKRADTVAEYLYYKGMPSDSLEVISNGSNKPVNNNLSWLNRKLNRRVDIYFQVEKK